MCGIVGIVPRRPADPRRLAFLVRRMADAVEHRGPDDEGFYVTQDVALGAKRLSIVDVAGSHQPILSEDGGRAIVFNGEIYNYRTLRRELQRAGRVFRTSGDAEVALQAIACWGSAGVRRLEGMFGLAVWDARRRTLTLARDPIGQKSIFTTETDDGWAFASEIKALLALDGAARAVDLATLSHYMSLRYLPGEGTLFEGITKLRAAHVVEVSAGGRSQTRYWAPSYEPKWKGTEDALLEELDSLMRTVVGAHLMGDVPVGAFLSGGIDSSLVVACASIAAGGGLPTFSIGVDEASQTELPWARRVAERYDTRHHETIVAPDLAALAPTMASSVEEPVDPFAAGVWLVSRETAQHVKVALGGDGGDELFAGYDRYLGQRLAGLYARLPAALRRGVLRPLLRRVPESFGYKSLAARLRWLDAIADRDSAERYAESAAFLRFTHASKARLFEPDVWRAVGERDSGRLLQDYFQDGCAEAFVDRMLHADCMTRLADHLLPAVDRMSMAHSLEVRSPFLDPQLVEFAMRIPAEMKLKSRRLKHLTRTLGARYLPRDLVERRKQGFGFPLGLWLRGPLRPLFERLVESSRLAAGGVFRRDEMRRLLREHTSGGVDHNFRLWMIFNLEIWYRHFIEREPVEDLEAWIAEARGGRRAAATSVRAAEARAS